MPKRKEVAAEAPLADPEDLYVPRRAPARRSIVLLAMQWEPETVSASEGRSQVQSDALRVRELQADGWSVCTVSDAGIFDTAGHASVRFDTLRGALRLAKLPPAQLVKLDYFWLQGGVDLNYYTTRYGENWPEKALMLLDAWPHLRAVMVPIDDGPHSSMRRQMTRIGGLGLSSFEVDIDGEPTVLARYSRRVEAALDNLEAGRAADAEGSGALASYEDVSECARRAILREGRVHSSQSWRADGYLAIVRKGEEERVREWLEVW